MSWLWWLNLHNYRNVFHLIYPYAISPRTFSKARVRTYGKRDNSLIMEQIPFTTIEFDIYPPPPSPDTSVPYRADTELHNTPYKSYGEIIPADEVNDAQESHADRQNHNYQVDPMVSLLSQPLPLSVKIYINR